MKCNLNQLLILLVIPGFILSTPQKSTVNQSEIKIKVGFIPLSGISLESLIDGGYGEGMLVYSTNTFPSVHMLAIKLTKELGSNSAMAIIIQIPIDARNFDLPELVDNVLDLPPTIVIESLDGWWLRDSVPSYNLDIQVWGPVYAMWGASQDPNSGTQSWLSEYGPNDLTVQIMVRDENHDGIPDWELRSKIPKILGRADISSNYAERKCESAVAIDPGIFPLWPYVSIEGGYEQLPGRLRPPVVLDIDSGEITHFSELVSVRGQNCTYAFYTIDPLTPNQLNNTNFEAPFALYDLSGNGTGYPNLILRTEHYPAGDRWFNQSTRDFETVRYSWRNEVGDGHWDYKIEVAGFHPYQSQTPIAADQILVDSPSYEQFPRWVLDHAWPAVTFVNTNGSPARSSEGIYTWSPRELGDDYLRGEVDKPNPNAFSLIPEGWQGEYRFTRDIPPKLYGSPIDKRLHLVGAEAGLINLGNGFLLHEENLDNELFIDSWTLEENDCADNNETSTNCHREIEESLYALDQFIVYSGNGEVEIRSFDSSPSIFELSPPAGPLSWENFVESATAFSVNQNDPGDLHSWLDDFPIEIATISGASISDVEVSRDGFQFSLILKPGYESFSENELLPITDLPAGRYLVHYDGEFQLTHLSPASAGLDLRANPHEDIDLNLDNHLLSIKAAQFPQTSGVILLLVLLSIFCLARMIFKNIPQ